MNKFISYNLLWVFLVCCVNFPIHSQSNVIYVSPIGNDSNNGFSKQMPFQTLQKAMDYAAQYKEGSNAGVKIELMAGVHYLNEPLIITPRHSGTKEFPFIISSAPGEVATISGGKKINGWKKNSTGIWETFLPEVQAGKWYFRQVYVNGELGHRARTPNTGFKIVEGMPEGTPETVGYHTDCQSFQYANNDLDPNWTNLEDVEVIVYHFWTDSHLPIKEIDTTSCVVTFQHKAGKVFTDDFSENGARYIVENIYEELDEPGEFYLNRKTGMLYYYPFDDEKINKSEVYAPVTENLVNLTGFPLKREYVEYVTFKNIRFSHTNFVLPQGNSNDRQGSASITAAINLKGAQNCSFTNCEISNIGNWAFEIFSGCQKNEFKANHIHDIAAGAFRVNGGTQQDHPLERTGYNTICHNLVRHYGEVFPSAVGILLMNTNANQVKHNHISYGRYTGILIGWEWGYQRSISRDNKIEYNHIHDIGKGLLSDMGAIYTLGISPGTVIRNNLIHDVESHHYGGWGIYNDEGSSHILVENNIVYNTKFSTYNIHFAKEITVRNNIFALARLQQLSRGRVEPHKSVFFENNIVYWKTGVLLDNNWQDEPYMFHFHPKDNNGTRQVKETFEMDYNLYFNPDKSLNEVDFNGNSFKEWNAMGKDTQSVYADPLFENPSTYNFSLKKESPAFKLGFKEIDMSNLGPQYHTGIIVK